MQIGKRLGRKSCRAMGHGDIIAYYDTPGQSACSYFEHQDILDKLARGDAAGAKSAMQHHLQDCEQRMSEPGKTPAADPWLAFSVKR